MRAATNTKRWTAEEEQKLIMALDQARKTHKGAGVWTEVSRIMGDRTESALQQHWCARARTEAEGGATWDTRAIATHA